MGFWNFLGKMWLFNRLLGNRHDNNVSYSCPSDSAHDHNHGYSHDNSYDSYSSSFDNDYSSCGNCSHDDYDCDTELDDFDDDF